MSSPASCVQNLTARLRPIPFTDSADAAPPVVRNRILAALDEPDLERLIPDLESVALPLGWTMSVPGEGDGYLYFPTSGLISRSCLLESGATTEFAVTGNDGVVGVSLFLGSSITLSQVMVTSEGHAYRLHAGLLDEQLANCDGLARLLMLYTQALITQVAQGAVCNRHHSAEQRLCRKLLTTIDLVGTLDLVVTHEQLGIALGVRRECISEAAAGLQRQGLLHCGRGHITIVDPAGLALHSCECYEVLKREYARLLGAGIGSREWGIARAACR